MTIRIGGMGERSYPLAPAACTVGGFAADAADGSGAGIQVADGRARVVIAAGAAPIDIDVTAVRDSGGWWRAEGASTATMTSLAVRAACA